MPLDIKTLALPARVSWTTEGGKLTAAQRHSIELQIAEKGEGPFTILQILDHSPRSCTCGNKEHHTETCPQWIVEHLGEYKKLIVADDGGQEFEILSFYLDLEGVSVASETPAQIIKPEKEKAFFVLTGNRERLRICPVEAFVAECKEFIFDPIQGIWLWNDQIYHLGESAPYSQAGGFILIFAGNPAVVLGYFMKLAN